MTGAKLMLTSPAIDYSHNQVGVGVEIGFLGKPVEALSSLRSRGHRKFATRTDLDQYMHPRMRRNAAAGEFSRDLASFGVEDDM